MPFFAPMPWEADAFYSQQGLIDKNITLDWQPLGTGAFMLEENNPNLRMVMLELITAVCNCMPSSCIEDVKPNSPSPVNCTA
jgi:hypothetical protein